MVDFKDSEKELYHESSQPTELVPSSDPSTNSIKKEEDKEIYSTRSNRSGLSHSSSASSDILSPLEHALTPDLRIESEMGHAELTNTKTGASTFSSSSRMPAFEVDFTPDDPDDPRNWPLWYRSMVIGSVSYATWAVVLYSTSYTSSMPGMMKEFHVTSEAIATLGVTFYLLGLAAGSLILAPLSEIYGRRPIYIGSLLFFSLMVVPCALAKGISVVLVFRFLGALAGAAMISNSPGTVADITNETYRALAFSVWSIGPMNGPVTGPLIGGFAAEYLGWRWTNWLVLIIALTAWFCCAGMKETYAPSILRQRAAKMRKETSDDRWWSRYDDRASVLEVLKINLSRPIILTATEPILWFWDAYVGIIYSILYLAFVAYPIIYGTNRGWSLGFVGLGFLGIGIGTMIAIVTEPLARRLIHSHPVDPQTGHVSPEASVSIVCIASILCPIGQLWFSWTCMPVTIHWIWPILAGVPYGAGNCLLFIYASNYVAGCYGVYSASALAGNTVVRSILGGTLPLAGPIMYTRLTPQWAGTLLGLLQVLCIPIPFVFYKWGAKIRGKSHLIRTMRMDQERHEKRAARAKKIADRRAAAERGEADEARIEDDEKTGVVETAEALGAVKEE